MNTPDAPNLNDLLKLGESAVSALLGAARDWQKEAVTKKDALVRQMDLVTREEFDVAFAMLKKIRAAQESLDKRLAALESPRSAKLAAPKKAPRKPSLKSAKKTPRKPAKKLRGKR